MIDINKRLNTKITSLGQKYIKSMCGGGGRKNLSGKFALSFCEPKSSVIMWNSNAKFNNQKILTDDDLGNSLIFWYNKYAEIFELDANILTAQVSNESGFNLLSYNNISSALGLNQFLSGTMFDIIIRNSYSSSSPLPFTDGEILVICKNLEGNKNSKGFLTDVRDISTGTTQGRKNRPALFQNVIDNPEIMIKAQCTYMRGLALKGNGFASVALTGYFIGQSVVSKTYVDTIAQVNIAKAHNPRLVSSDPIAYNYKLFVLLENKFGYELGITKPSSIFPPYDPNNIDIHNSNVTYK